MRSNRLNSILDKLFASEAADQNCKRALEADLLSRYRTLHPQNRRWLMLLNPWNRFARFALTALILCFVVIGACTTETITEVELGKRMQVGLEAGGDDQSAQDPLSLTFQFSSPGDVTREAKKLSDILIAQPGVSDASVSINQQSGGEVSLDMLVWGKDLDTDGLMNVLQESYPALANACVSVNDLTTTIKESFASKIKRELLHVEVSGSDPEELRQQILEQMAAQGFTGDAAVHVHTEGDQQIIHIEMEE